MVEQIGDAVEHFGPFIAFLATIIAGVIVYWIQLKGRRSTIRMSFLEELESNQGLDSYIAQRDENREEGDKHYLKKVRPLGCPYTTSVYENSVEEIGILTDKEIEALVDFYSLAIITRNRLEAILNLENSWRGVQRETVGFEGDKDLETLTVPFRR